MYNSEGPAVLEAHVALTEQTRLRLETHLRLLAEWNVRMNLVGPKELARYWSRHALDSAQLIALAPADAARWLDLGSGAGFPGLVIAALIADRPGARVHLVEKSPKKAEFLKAAVAAMEVPVGVFNARAEDVRVQPYDVITARAFAPLQRLMEHAKPYLAEGAVGLFPKGADYEAELTAAGFQPKGGGYFQGSMHAEALGSLTDPGARVLRIVNAA
jgi:16S rRNA (guanine527-N7)-methyltransferase